MIGVGGAFPPFKVVRRIARALDHARVTRDNGEDVTVMANHEDRLPVLDFVLTSLIIVVVLTGWATLRWLCG